jgi:uncharacterized protein (DUF983 family)
MSRFNALISQKCPRCEKGNIYKKGNYFSFGKMNDFCPSCNYTFEIEPGYFYGAMYVGYGLTVAEAITTYVISQFFFDSVYMLMALIFCSLILLAPVNFKFSRVIWMYIFTSTKGTI